MKLFAPFLTAFLMLLAGVAEPLMAQYFYFGKNRVQYENFDWRYIETEHFDIYYYDAKNYHLAQFTAETLESSLKQISEDLGSPIADRISVIIYDSHSDFSQTNVVALPVDAQGIGGVTDKYKNRMTQPFMGDYADFRRTLQHELLHAYINDVYYGGNIQSIIQNNLQLVFPLWFEEGLAEYLALGWDTQSDMFMRDAVINNYLPPLAQLGGYFAYRGGQSFWYFVENEYGRGKISEILQRIRTIRNVERSLTLSLGLTVEEISERWQEFYRKRYLPEVANRSTLRSVATQITTRASSGSYNTSPALSPNGDRLAMISNRRGVFDVVIVDVNTRERIKTLIRGADNPMFEELNILNPNISWSPDGRRIVLSSKSGGRYGLAIVEVANGQSRWMRVPDLDSINSVAWSPDGKKIAFDGNIGPYQDIFVYDLASESVVNLTNDIFTDKEPEWDASSERIYFVSNRGDHVSPGVFREGFSGMGELDFFETDLYRVHVGGGSGVEGAGVEGMIERLTQTPLWVETQPTITGNGELYFVSDENGIPNIYLYDFETMSSRPVTDLQSGVMQISVSSDGSLLAFNSLNEGYPDIFLMRSPRSNVKQEPLTPNEWALERNRELPGDRVPSIEYVGRLIQNRTAGNLALNSFMEARIEDADGLGDVTEQEDADETGAATETGATTDIEAAAEADTDSEERLDFRNYQFAADVIADSTLQLTVLTDRFSPVDNVNESGYYVPKRYRLKFSPDFTYAAGQISTQYGSAAFAYFTLSDLFGDHQLSIGSNLVFDLRNSDYSIQYAYLKNRTNFAASFFHQARNYQTFFGDLLRFRTYGGGIDFQYPLNRYQRVDYGVSMIGIARDFSTVQSVGEQNLQNDRSSFLYPQISFTGDFSIPGFITPVGGNRYSLQLSGSPGIGVDAPQFVTLLGDYRRYLYLGRGYSLGIRGAGAASFGPDSQTFFMGGMLGWINQRWSDAEIPFDRLADTFFTLPATPLRGHEYNTLFGNKFSLINAEFRFPLFAAILPGPVPVIPLYNITGVAFFDVGAAWGFDIPYSRFSDENGPIVYFEKSSDLDFRVAEKKEVFLDPGTGLISDVPTSFTSTYVDGDVLIGAGFGLRTILLGLPFRYDVGWPYYRDGFQTPPIHYFTIGIDF